MPHLEKSPYNDGFISGLIEAISVVVEENTGQRPSWLSEDLYTYSIRDSDKLNLILHLAIKAKCIEDFEKPVKRIILEHRIEAMEMLPFFGELKELWMARGKRKAMEYINSLE